MSINWVKIFLFSKLSQYEYEEGSEKSFRLTTGPLQVKLEKLFVTNDDN